MLLTMNKGRVMQSDPNDEHGDGPGIAPSEIEMGTVVFHPAYAAYQQASMGKADQKSAALAQKAQTFQREKARADGMSEHFKRQSILNNQPETPTRDEMLLDAENKRKNMQRMMGSADFDEFETIPDTGDFGSEHRRGGSRRMALGSYADFEQNGVYNSPKVPYGNFGPDVQDWPEYIKAKSFNQPVSMGMGCPAPQGANMGKLTMSYPAKYALGSQWADPDPLQNWALSGAFGRAMGDCCDTASDCCDLANATPAQASPPPASPPSLLDTLASSVTSNATGLLNSLTGKATATVKASTPLAPSFGTTTLWGMTIPNTYLYLAGGVAIAAGIFIFMKKR